MIRLTCGDVSEDSSSVQVGAEVIRVPRAARPLIAAMAIARRGHGPAAPSLADGRGRLSPFPLRRAMFGLLEAGHSFLAIEDVLMRSGIRRVVAAKATNPEVSTRFEVSAAPTHSILSPVRDWLRPGMLLRQPDRHRRTSDPQRRLREASIRFARRIPGCPMNRRTIDYPPGR